MSWHADSSLLELDVLPELHIISSLWQTIIAASMTDIHLLDPLILSIGTVVAHP